MAKVQEGQVLGSKVHCTTQPEPRGVSDIGFSLCAAPNYLILMSEYFRCVLGTLRITRSVWKLSGSLEVNLELRIVQREVSIEVKNKARAWEVTRIISGSPEQRFKGGQ